ncbi:guanine nucleotide exchange factor [Mycena pura]|uniref:Guanine nucleotide exchange factor n=1 Tax=Mycena pura TaxID=153505 RepID=A0AAD7E556_9AGAR|nr:guanine nucleotide exchange factor [Mycena pura]
MSTLLEQYRAAASSDVLDAIVNAGPFALDQNSRAELIQSLLNDLQSSKGRISSKDTALALLALKTLGRNKAGSEALGTAPNLSILLTLFASLKDDQEAAREALRCIANALLNFETARPAFISEEVNGGETCISFLQKSTNPDQIFILSRILFLSTVHPSSFITSLVEEKHHGHTFVDIISGKLDLLITTLLSGAKMSREAMVDVLKFTFNILMHYPKSLVGASSPDGNSIIGDNWSPRLDGILPPLLRVFHALPPTFPAPIAAPLTHVIHNLLAIPVNSTLRNEWFGSPPSSSGTSSPKPVPMAVVPGPRRGDSSSSSRTHSPVRSGTPALSRHSTLDRALSVLSAGRRSLSRSPSPIPPSPPSPRPSNTTNKSPADTLLRTHLLLEVAFTHYFPDTIDPDDPSVREMAKAEAGPNATTETLDEELSPLVVLVGRLCAADEVSRTRTREWICPADLDRSAAAGSLESRPNMLGRCLRLLGSVYHSRLKDSVGEMLYAVCDSDATTMSTLLGYGNVAGFLFNKGIMSAPPPPTELSTASAALSAAAAENINPITGTVQAERPPEPEMTQEEKEREMEKLFVLFDRLERTGALPPSQNPMRKAIEKAATASSG